MGETEGGRSPIGVSPIPALPAAGGDNGVAVSLGGEGGVDRPDPEVLERPKRRQYTAEYKARILAEADACVAPGQLGALLRREGLYSSSLATWRRQHQQGVLAGLTPKRRGRKRQKDPLAEENARLRRENVRLQEKLRQAEAIIEIQKKVSELLGIPLKTLESEGDN